MLKLNRFHNLVDERVRLNDFNLHLGQQVDGVLVATRDHQDRTTGSDTEYAPLSFSSPGGLNPVSPAVDSSYDRRAVC